MINKLNRKHFEQIKVRDNAFVTKLKHSNFLKVLTKAFKKVNSCSMIRSQVKAGLVSGPAFRSG